MKSQMTDPTPLENSKIIDSSVEEVKDDLFEDIELMKSIYE